MINYYYLRGPINSGSQVLLSFVQNGYLYFLTKNGNNLIMDPRNPTLLGGPEPVILNVNVQNNTTITMSIVNGNNVVLDQNNFLMNSTNAAVQLTPTATDLNVPSLLVAGPYYQLSSSGSQAQVYAYTPVPIMNTGPSVFAPDIQLDDSGNAVLQQLTGNFRFIPIKYYLTGNCSQTLATLSEVITNEANWNEDQLFDQDVPYQTGFTLQTDCNNNVFYNYCFLPASCGEASNCFGTCSNSSQTCTLNTGNSTFSCSGSSSNKVQWYWYLILGIILLIIIILIILAFVYAFKPSYQTETVETVNTSQLQPVNPVYSENFGGEESLL
jgi:hypothetical protein